MVPLIIPAPDLNVPATKISGSGLSSTSFQKLNRDSILDTITVFDEFFNTGIDVVQDLIAWGADAVDGAFESVEKGVGS